MQRPIETRFCAPSCRYSVSDAAPSSSGKLALQGFAVLWDDLSHEIRENGRVFRERFRKGAFAESLRNGVQFMLVEHQGNPLAVTTDGSLELRETGDGLHFTARLDLSDPDVQREERRLRRLKGVSFSFRAIADNWEKVGVVLVRTITKADLIEISPVGSPAYAATSYEVSQRSWKAQAEARERTLQLLQMKH